VDKVIFKFHFIFFSSSGDQPLKEIVMKRSLLDWAVVSSVERQENRQPFGLRVLQKLAQ